MRAVVIGSGGREHALAWALAGSASVQEVVVMPGNPGMARDSRYTVVPEPPDGDSVARYNPDLVVIGPEAFLVAGLADDLRRRGIAVVGPSRAAAALEGSKRFSKELMDRHGIPTAAYRVCSSPEEARAVVEEFGLPVVVKADGLAQGKGVSVCTTVQHAHGAIQKMMEERQFGDAGATVVVEQFLQGFEASVMVMMDETSHLVLPTARDHKQIHDNNLGPNTGGMGAVAPNPEITPAMQARIELDVVIPSVTAVRSLMQEDPEALFRGFLFIGVMISDGVPRVLEYNVRFGDPEAQAILPLLEGDLGVLFRGLAHGTLRQAKEESQYRTASGSCCAVVAASPGYPGRPHDGFRIHEVGVPGLLFWAGVRAGDENGLMTSGGRVCAAAGRGDSLDAAREAAYRVLLGVQFTGMQFRRDIGGAPIDASLLEEDRHFLPQYYKRGGVLPVVVQDARSGEVLMLGYANHAAVVRTMETGLATFWSTSRARLWTKGESSGNTLMVQEVRVDCDQDALLYRVTLSGSGVCHTTEEDGSARRRCFYRVVERDENGSLVLEHPSESPAASGPLTGESPAG